MTSTCLLFGVGEPVTDPVTFEVTTPEVPVYTGPCRVRPASGAGGDSAAGAVAGVENLSFDYLVSVPFSVTEVRERQRVRILASPDLALVGVEVEVQHVDRGEHISARRLQCREVA